MVGTNFNSKQNSSVNISLTDDLGLATQGECFGDPNRYATESGIYTNGCFLRRTDTAIGANIYWNVGTSASPNWSNTIGGGGVVFGDPATGYANNEIIYVNNFGNLWGDSQFTRDQFTGDTNIGLFNGGNGITIGDINNQNNGTYVFVNDIGKTLWLYSTETVLGGNIGLGNNTYFTVDDVQQKFIVSGTWTNTAVADGFSLNFSTQVFAIGDVQSNGNQTVLTVDDAGRQITGKTNIFTVGDTDGTGQNTYIYLRDNAHAIDIYNEGIISFRSPMSGEDIVTINTPTKHIRLGDIASSGNDTLLTIQDAAGRITSNASIHRFGFNAQPNLLYLDYGNAIYWIGAAGSGNGTSIIMNDGGTDRYIEATADRHFDVRTNGGISRGLLVDFFNDDYAIGDLNGTGNHNILWIEDDNDIVSIRTPGLFQVTDPSNAQWMEVDIGTGISFIGNTVNLSVNQSAGRISATNAVFRLTGYTVATLPAGAMGDTAYVTDALGASWGVAIAGGGVQVVPVFFNGSIWIAA